VDPERKSLIDDGELENSLVAHVRSLRLPNTRISRIARSGLWGLSIEVGRESAPHLVEHLDRRDDLVGWSLLGYEDPEADAIMVWHSGTPPTAIVPGPPRASRFTLNFVIVVRREEDGLDWVEDGAIWALSQETWSRLTEAIRNGDELYTKVGESPVRWAWLSPAKPESTVQLEAVQLLTSNEQALRAVTTGEAAGLIERTERALIEVAKEFTHEPLKLLVQLALQQDGGLRVQYQSTNPDGEDLYRAVSDALGRQYWPMLPGDEIEIAMQFNLQGSAEGLPDPPHNLSTAPEGKATITEKETPADPFANYVRVHMTIWSEVDTQILVDGEYVTDVDHTTGFDYASANITISPSSQITFKATSFEITRSVIQFVDPEERTLEARIGTSRNCEVIISEEQKLAAMGSPEDIPRLTADLLTNVESSVRYTAAERLGYIRDRAAVPALLEALDSDVDPYVLACVARALGRIGDTSVIPALEKALENYDRKESYGYMFEAALRDLAFVRNREERDPGT
jgi:hypothetical protein